MGKIYNNQALKYIKLNTKIDLTAGINPRIAFRKPDGTTGEWNATIEDGTFIKCSVDNNILTPGRWKVQPVVTIDNHVFRGETYSFTVNELFT